METGESYGIEEPVLSACSLSLTLVQQDEPLGGIRHVRRIQHPGRGMGGTRARRTFNFQSTAGLSGLSPNTRDTPMDPIAGRIAQNFLLNPLRTKFFRGNINIYLHFMSLLHIDMTHVLKIDSQVRPGPTYSI